MPSSRRRRLPTCRPRWGTPVSSGCGGCAGRFGTGPRTLCIGRPSDLGQMFNRNTRFDSIRVVAPLTLEQQKRWEHRLFALYSECGCSAGSVALLVVLAVSAGHALLWPPLPGWHPIAAVLLMCFVAAVTGKMVGIKWSRFRLTVEARRLAGILEALACTDRIISAAPRSLRNDSGTPGLAHPDIVSPSSQPPRTC